MFEPACRSPVQYGISTSVAVANGLFGSERSRIVFLRFGSEFSNCVAPTGPCSAVFSTRQVVASQHAPPASKKTTRSGPVPGLTPMPVVEPSSQFDCGTLIHVHLSTGATILRAVGGVPICLTAFAERICPAGSIGAGSAEPVPARLAHPCVMTAAEATRTARGRRGVRIAKTILGECGVSVLHQCDASHVIGIVKTIFIPAGVFFRASPRRCDARAVGICGAANNVNACKRINARALDRGAKRTSGAPRASRAAVRVDQYSAGGDDVAAVRCGDTAAFVLCATSPGRAFAVSSSRAS